jgi:bacteriocin biosynthesis cyclodehydratase domain-containing protein
MVSMGSSAAVRPRFKSSVQPISSDSGLFLLSESRQAWIPEPIYAAVAPMLDGTHEIETIFAALSDTYPVEQVFAVLDQLRTSGYLAEDTLAEAPPIMAFWEHLGVCPSLARSRLDVARVSTVAFGEIDLGPLTDLLGRHGVRIACERDITVVVTDDYLRPQLATWNAQALTSSKPWLLVKPVGIETWIGPMFVPGQTACWECLAQRLRGHRKLERYIARRGGTDAPVGAIPAYIASTQHAALAEAATEITRWIATSGQSTLLDQVVSTSVITLERTRHALTRRPQCPSCGSAEPNIGAVPRPVCFHQRPKAHTSDGGRRALGQRQVLAQLERHLSPITGIVRIVVPGERTSGVHRGEGCLTPTFAADHSFSDVCDDRFFLKEIMRRRSGGKGKSVDQARTSALAESLERYCGVFDGTEPRIRASFADLGTAAVHPNTCMGYSERQYAARKSHNNTGQKARWVPEPFREDVEIEWTPLWSLSADEPRYLPTSFCYYGYGSPDPLFARADSNGCAAGSVLEDAVLQGLLELIERDAVALWWYNRLRRRAVDLENIDDAYVSKIIRHYGDLRRELWALDITSDFGVPTFAALSRRVDKEQEDIIYGFGAHLDPSVALARALTELNQSLEAVPTTTGPDSSRTYRGSQDAVRWWRTVKKADTDYLMPDLEAPPCRLHDFKSLATDDLQQDILVCKALAETRGIEILVLDQTRPDVRFPVVRVVAPGLRHFWARFGPGRLYDVPLREGWLPRSRDEREMNPFIIQM